MESTENTTNLVVNGTEMPIDGSPTISSLLEKLQVKSPAIAVEVNGEIVARDHFDEQLKDGDKLEIVTLAGGG